MTLRNLLDILEPSDLIYLMREGSDVESDWFDVPYTDAQKIVKKWDEMFIKADASGLLVVLDDSILDEEVLDANKNGYEVGQRTFVVRFANTEYNPE